MVSHADIYEYFDRRFSALRVSSAHLEELFSDGRWTEGPVWFNDGGYLLWSDIPNNRMLRWIPDHGVSLFRENSPTPSTSVSTPAAPARCSPAG